MHALYSQTRYAAPCGLQQAEIEMASAAVNQALRHWQRHFKLGLLSTGVGLLALCRAVGAATSSDVIINEFSQGSSGAKEWVEILVVTDNLNLQNHKLIDGNGSLSITLAGSGFASLRAGTLIVVYNGGDVDGTIVSDLSYNPTGGDYRLEVSSLNNSGSFAVTRTAGWSGTTGAFANGSSTDVPQLVDAQGTTFYSFPRTPTPNSAKFSAYSGGNTGDATLATNWTADAASSSATPGAPNPAGSNPSWITSLRSGTATRIHDIQGAAHLSPKNNQAVSNIPGIVTALRSNGFYLQDPTSDSDPATSEGIFVYTGSTPTVSVGSSLQVSGTVSEYVSGGSTSGNLSTTEIITPTITTLSTGNALPAATVIGSGGRIPPNLIIEDDATATGNVNTSGVFDPASDGIDFYESLEGMRVQINNAVVVGPTNSSGEIAVLGDNGSNASGRTLRGGIAIGATDFNPERLILSPSLVSNPPKLNVADRFNASIVGIVDYSSGNFKILNTAALPSVTVGGLTQESTALVGSTKQLTVAAFNLENFNTAAGSRIQTLASYIAKNLKAPDILSIEEIQDNSGPTDDGVVDASQTLAALTSAITSAGGPAYQYRQIDPINDQDGGQPGGNIRQVLLFNPARISFIDRPGGGSTVATTAATGSGGPQLTYSPGRIDPTNTAFSTSRKPLAGEFLFNGQHLFVIANHLNSKGGDTALFGAAQPPVLNSQPQRVSQATVINSFVSSILALDSQASIVVLGDLNDFEFSQPLLTLKGTTLTNLIEKVAANDRYIYIYEGNSQAIDHILVSPYLSTKAEIDIVHVDSEFVNQASDHEAVVARFTFP